MLENEATALERYHADTSRIAGIRSAGNYTRKTIHDVNNSLAKINNALWLMAREENEVTPFFKQCQQIIEHELDVAKKMLDM